MEAFSKVEIRMDKLHKCGCSSVYPLILTDINMPIMDGISLTRNIRQLIKTNLINSPRFLKRTSDESMMKIVGRPTFSLSE